MSRIKLNPNGCFVSIGISKACILWGGAPYLHGIQIMNQLPSFSMIIKTVEEFLSMKIIDFFQVEPKVLIILVSILFFLVSFLFNLLQRRRSSARVERLLEKEKSMLNFLGTIDEYLGRLERSCAFQLHRASSPQEMGKGIYIARDKIKSTMAAMEEHLHLFGHHRKKEKKQKSQTKQLKKSLNKNSFK